MNIEQAIAELKMGVNKNASNRNIDIDLGRAIIALNQAQSTYVRAMIEGARSTDKIDLVNKLLVPFNVKRTKKDGNTQEFSITETTIKGEAIRIESAVGVASKGGCQRQVAMYPIMTRNASIVGLDHNSKADWVFEVAPYTISDDKIVVDADFNIASIKGRYYREPVEVDIKGYPKADGTPSKTVEFEFSTSVIREIIEIAKTNIINNNKIVA